VLGLDLGLKLRVFKVSSKCRDIGDVHQGIVCMLLNAICGERFLDQEMFSQGYLSAKRDLEPSGELRILHFVDDVYRDLRYCSKDPHPRRRYSEGQVCHIKEFEIGHPLLNQTMYIIEDVHRGRRW